VCGKNNEAKIETKIKPCLPRKLLRVSRAEQNGTGASLRLKVYLFKVSTFCISYR